MCKCKRVALKLGGLCCVICIANRRNHNKRGEKEEAAQLMFELSKLDAHAICKWGGQCPCVFVVLPRILYSLLRWRSHGTPI